MEADNRQLPNNPNPNQDNPDQEDARAAPTAVSAPPASFSLPVAAPSNPSTKTLSSNAVSETITIAT
jgi:hypothetical protein